ncbi:hypothetical protein N9937_00680 [bacterium]|nr:hypothetical protein [bacterium]
MNCAAIAAIELVSSFINIFMIHCDATAVTPRVNTKHLHAEIMVYIPDGKKGLEGVEFFSVGPTVVTIVFPAALPLAQKGHSVCFFLGHGVLANGHFLWLWWNLWWNLLLANAPIISASKFTGLAARLTAHVRQETVFITSMIGTMPTGFRCGVNAFLVQSVNLCQAFCCVHPLPHFLPFGVYQKRGNRFHGSPCLGMRLAVIRQ